MTHFYGVPAVRGALMWTCLTVTRKTYITVTDLDIAYRYATVIKLLHELSSDSGQIVSKGFA